MIARDALDAAVGEAAAALTFSEAIPVEVPAIGGERYGIDLIEPPAGRLVLELADADAELLASAAWGAFRPEGVDAREQFLFEFLNVIAGRCLSHGCPDRPIRIGFPQRVADEGVVKLRAAYDLDGATVRFAVEERAA